MMNISDLTIEDGLRAFDKLGDLIKQRPDSLVLTVKQAVTKNKWFEEKSIWKALDSMESWLQHAELKNWIAPYSFEHLQNKTVGLVFAGNIPLVGFHDFLSVICAGFKCEVKLSSNDEILNNYLIQQLIQIEPRFSDRIKIVERLGNFDCVIATGSNNTSRYFEYYFGKKPNIIRKNRNSVAVLTGKESDEEIFLLGKDVFDYFGMGCRNVSKIYVPDNYDLTVFLKAIEAHEDVKNNFKYFNNYEFQKSIFLINGDQHLDNGFLLLKEDSRLASPLSVLFVERYKNLEDVKSKLTEIQDSIQCVVTGCDLDMKLPQVGFGETQNPKLTDYADQIDTLAFIARQI